MRVKAEQAWLPQQTLYISSGESKQPLVPYLSHMNRDDDI